MELCDIWFVDDDARGGEGLDGQGGGGGRAVAAEYDGGGATTTCWLAGAIMDCIEEGLGFVI